MIGGPHILRLFGLWYDQYNMFARSWKTPKYRWKNSRTQVSLATTMGWLRLVGSLKLQVSFAEYRLFYRDLLQKKPTIWRSLRIVATPYTWVWPHQNDSCRSIWSLVQSSFAKEVFYVSFAEYRLFYRALLQKRPIIINGLLVVATPYLV